MNIRLDRPTPHDYPRLGEICCNAFAAFQKEHGFEPDFPEPAVAEGFIRAICDAGDVAFAVAAYEERAAVVAAISAAAGSEDPASATMRPGRPLPHGQAIGSNFCTCFDGVGGVGPITVGPSAQASGVGRKLMSAVLNDADRRGVKSVRLMQDAHNARSLSLYASLGFDQKACCAAVQMPTDRGPQKGVRAADLNGADAAAIDAVSRRIYRLSRANEMRWAQKLDTPCFVIERGGVVVGYGLPFVLGHFAAETTADALALLTHAAAHVPAPHMARFFIPLHQGELFRAVLSGGGRVMRTMNLMARGTYEEPRGVWGPSIMF